MRWPVSDGLCCRARCDGLGAWGIIPPVSSAVLAAIAEDPCYAKMRAADGRGPLFWAHEFSLDALVDALVDAGADPEAKDAGGKTPKQMPKAPPLTFEVPEDDDEYDPFEDYVEVMGGDGALKAEVGAHDEM